MSYEIDGVRLVDDVGNVYDIEEWLDMHGYVELPRDANGITDELREFVDGADGYELWCPRHKKELTAIADRIDAEYEKGIVDALLNDGLPMSDEIMAEHGWVRLPVDADGVPIRVGDVMESNGANSLFGQASFEVRAMRYDEGGWEVYDRLGDRYMPSLLRHYKPPTVEDVLREMLYKAHIYDEREMELLPDLIAEYASKFQLKENK